MSLPKLHYPIFELEVPSVKKNLKFRPFLVKEEKLLLTAQQTGEIKEIVLALKQIINNCIVEGQSFDIETLTLFDIEFLFLKLRAKSVNNVVDITVIDKEDEKEYKLKVDLEEVKIINNPEHINNVDVGNNINIKLRYPKVDLIDKIQMMAANVEMFFEVIKYCIEEVKQGDVVYKLSDYSDQEVEEFVQQINVEGFNKITKFFDTMPKMYYEIKYTNSNNNEQTIKLETLADFFTLA